jgi:ABC-2 type transport system ATP-binding protein
VAHGSLEELRAGVQAKLQSAEHDARSRLTLEQIFLSVVGKDSSDMVVREGELAWLS